MTWIGVLRMERALASNAPAFGLVATVTILLLVARPAHATTFNVTNTNDSGQTR